MGQFLDIVTLVSAVILVTLILLQTRGASLGAGLGGGGDAGGGSVRRGSERTIHQITIILAIVFSLSLIAGFFF